MTPDEISLIFNIVNAVVIILTGIFVAWQVRLMQLANRASAYSIIFSILQSEEIREARKKILGTNEPYSNWTIDLKNHAEKVGHTYDTIGIMLKRGVVPYSYVVEEWHDSIIKCWEKTKDMIGEYRGYRGDDFWDDFETLYEKSTDFEKSHKIREKMKITILGYKKN